MAKQKTGKNTDSTLKKTTTNNVLKALYTDQWFGFLDLVLLIITLLLPFGEAEVLLIFIFFFLTLGAFYWELRAFVLRSGFWVAVATVTVLTLLYSDEHFTEELVEIVVLSGILASVYIIASQRKRAEEALREANEELENRVVERTAELTRVNVELVHEITERKQTEKTLRKLSSVVEQTADNVLITNKGGVIEYVNPAFEKNTGYMKEEAIGQTPRILKSGQQGPRFYEEFWETILSGRVHRGVVINKKKGGELYYEEHTITPIRDIPGNIIHFVSTGKDITKRKRAEDERERLLVTEREQRLLAETLGEVFLALTAQTSHETVLDEILHQLQRIVSHSAANIMLLKDDALHIVRYQGYQDFSSEDLVFGLEQSLADFPLDAEVIRFRQPLVIPDTDQNPHWVTIPESAWIKSFVAVPICLHNHVLGLLRLDSDIVNKFSTQDIERLQPLANAAAIALENARLYDQARREIAERKQAEKELRRVAARNQAILKAIPDSIFQFGRDGRLLNYKVQDSNSPQGLIGAMTIGKDLSEMLPPDLADLTLQYIGKTLDTGKTQIFDYQLPLPQAPRDFEAQLAVSGPNEILAIVRDVTKRKAQAVALEKERIRIARDLHDSLGQNLGYLRFKLDEFTISNTLLDRERIRQELVQMRDVANEAYELVRNILAAIRPSNSADLATALLAQTRLIGNRARFKVKLTVEGQVRFLSPVIQQQVLYICQEALINVEKHANALQVDINLQWTEDTLTIDLSDDGRGFETKVPQPDGHFGLTIMQERAEEIKGLLSITSNPGSGTELTLRLPLTLISQPSTA